eukprot:6007118-Pleurochrysis_carterae.AAC.2
MSTFGYMHVYEESSSAPANRYTRLKVTAAKVNDTNVWHARTLMRRKIGTMLSRSVRTRMIAAPSEPAVAPSCGNERTCYRASARLGLRLQQRLTNRRLTKRADAKRGGKG